MKKQTLLITLLIACALWLPVVANAETIRDPYSKIDEYLQRSAERANIPGMSVIIVDKGSVLFSNVYGNGDSINTPFIIGSMSKSFTAVSIMQLVEQGKVKLDDTISTYLPYVTDGDKITVKQLLNQTSGLGEHQNLSNLEITDSYGTHQYANVNYSLLGKIIEAASGISYEDYVTEAIFSPLEMNHSAASLKKSKEHGLIDGYRNFFGIPVAGEPDYPNENSWSQVSAGYISSSASDMGKYLQMYLNGGKNVITAKSVDTIFYDNVNVNSSVFYSYGMGWTLSQQYYGPILGHSGLVENYISNMFILPKRGIGIVLLMNTNDYLVTNGMVDKISGSLVYMLMGGNPIEISKTTYLTSHLFFNGIYLAIVIVAFLPLLFLKRYKKKLSSHKASRILPALGILHIIFPTVLLLFPRLIETPLWVVRYFVPDLFLVLITSATLLYIGGFIKVMLFYKAKKSAPA